MQNLRFPLHFTFKVTTLANDFVATDAGGHTVAYVRQKMLRLKEDIQVYADENRSRELYRIRADRWLDWSAAYAFYDASGRAFGKVARKGWRSLWRAEYGIVDAHGKARYRIREENGWIKVMDGLVGEIPVLGALTGYVLNPSYVVTDRDGASVARIRKRPSFFGRKFRVDRLAPTPGEEDDDRILLGLMMMILLERRRG